jgi:hypothetical protein
LEDIGRHVVSRGRHWGLLTPNMFIRCSILSVNTKIRYRVLSAYWRKIKNRSREKVRKSFILSEKGVKNRFLTNYDWISKF